MKFTAAWNFCFLCHVLQYCGDLIFLQVWWSCSRAAKGDKKWSCTWQQVHSFCPGERSIVIWWLLHCYDLKKHTAFWTVILNQIPPPPQIAFVFGFISNAVQSMMSAVEFLPQNSAWPINLIVGTKGQFRPVYILSLLIVKWSLFRSRYTCNLVWPSIYLDKKKRGTSKKVLTALCLMTSGKYLKYF